MVKNTKSTMKTGVIIADAIRKYLTKGHKTTKDKKGLS